MKLLVLVAGVLDPKWPVVPDAGGLPLRNADRLMMSPFDEAALEIALKLRDADPSGISISAIIAGGVEAEKLARSVAAFNIADITCCALDAAWDQGAAARALARGLDRDADLILIGREFGDCDDGVVPAALAGLLDRPIFSHVQSVATRDGKVRLMREVAGCEEWLSVTRPLLASITNDRRSRLRKPLIKNVMMARQARISRRDFAGSATSGASLGNVAALVSDRVSVGCEMIAGAPADQAKALAALLLEANR